MPRQGLHNPNHSTAFQRPSFSLRAVQQDWIQGWQSTSPSHWKHWGTCCRTHWSLHRHIQRWKRYTSDSLQQRWPTQILLWEFGKTNSCELPDLAGWLCLGIPARRATDQPWRLCLRANHQTKLFPVSISTCKVHSGVDTQVLFATAEPSAEDTTVGSSVRSITCSTTVLARPQLHTSRLAKLFATSIP